MILKIILDSEFRHSQIHLSYAYKSCIYDARMFPEN
jgi:hypothetical protein